MMQALNETIDRKVKQYNEDLVIKAYTHQLNHVMNLATPRILVPLNNIEERVFDIDGKSKALVQKITEEMKDYQKTNYPELFPTKAIS